jgi:hypothetical protein
VCGEQQNVLAVSGGCPAICAMLANAAGSADPRNAFVSDPGGVFELRQRSSEASLRMWTATTVKHHCSRSREKSTNETARYGYGCEMRCGVARLSITC